jgi:hypothetical protein
MANIKLVYGASTDITITLASLADGSARESTAIDNTANLFEDAEVYLAVKLAAGSPASAEEIRVFCYASEDGSNYTDNASGSNAAITLRAPTNLKVLDVISTPDSGALTYKLVIGSIASAWGNYLPPKWGIVVSNVTGLAFDGTEGNHTKKYRGIYHSVT